MAHLMHVLATYHATHVLAIPKSTIYERP
jgi:hypothetical protein